MESKTNAVKAPAAAPPRICGIPGDPRPTPHSSHNDLATAGLQPPPAMRASADVWHSPSPSASFAGRPAVTQSAPPQRQGWRAWRPTPHPPTGRPPPPPPQRSSRPAAALPRPPWRARLANPASRPPALTAMAMHPQSSSALAGFRWPAGRSTAASAHAAVMAADAVAVRDPPHGPSRRDIPLRLPCACGQPCAGQQLTRANALHPPPQPRGRASSTF